MTLPRWPAQRRLGIVLPLLLGAIAATGQAPFGFWPLTLAALAGVIWMATAAPDRKAAAWFGWLAGTGHFLVALHWLVEPFLVDVARHGWMAPFAVTFMAMGLSLFWALAFALGARRGPLVLALALTLAEYARSVLFTGFPWALLGHVWIDTPVAQTARLAGAHGLTALTMVLAALPALLPGRRLLRIGLPVALTAAMFAGTLGWSRLTPAPPPEDAAPVVRIVQPNAPQDEKWQAEMRDVFFGRALDFTAAGPTTDLVVWPETSVPYFLEYAPEALDYVARAARGATSIVGLQRYEGDRYYNTLVVVGADGRPRDVYDKSHLVPFGEYVPFGDLMARFGIHGLAANEGGGYSSGPGSTTVEIPGIGTALPLICYEGIFAEEVGAVPTRPRVMVLITNDAWFGTFAGPQQHLAQARLRAIEQGLPMIRAANTGVSAMIDARGRLVATIPLGEAGYVDTPLPAALPPTLYARLGDWLPVGLVLATLAGALLWRRRL